MTTKVGINFKPKNPVEVLDFHKAKVWLNGSRIYTLKIRERGIRRKHLVFDKGKKKDMQQPLGSANLDCSRRPGMRSPQHTSSQ